jgi:hypothetical protein
MANSETSTRQPRRNQPTSDEMLKRGAQLVRRGTLLQNSGDRKSAEQGSRLVSIGLKYIGRGNQMKDEEEARREQHARTPEDETRSGADSNQQKTDKSKKKKKKKDKEHHKKDKKGKEVKPGKPERDDVKKKGKKKKKDKKGKKGKSEKPDETDEKEQVRQPEPYHEAERLFGQSPNVEETLPSTSPTQELNLADVVHGTLLEEEIDDAAGTTTPWRCLLCTTPPQTTTSPSVCPSSNPPRTILGSFPP